jgi:hypothetical protein
MWGEASRWDRKVGVSFKRGPESWEDLQERARKCEGHASKLTTGTCYEFFFITRLTSKMVLKWFSELSVEV